MTEVNLIEVDEGDVQGDVDRVHIQYDTTFDDAVSYIASLISTHSGYNYDIESSHQRKKIVLNNGAVLLCVKNRTRSDYPNKSLRMTLTQDYPEVNEEVKDLFGAGGVGVSTESGGFSQEDDMEVIGAGNVGGATKGNPEIYNNGAVEFLPEFDKNGADYLPAGQNNTGNHCQDCVHYIEGGGCHLVRGEIDPRAYCDLYADFGLFGMNNRGTAVLNLKMWGEEYSNKISEGHISEFLNKIEREMRKRL